MRHALLVIACSGVLLLTACSTATTVTSTWRDPAYQKAPRKVLVVGLLPNQQYRKRMESTFAERLNARGLSATPGFAVFPQEQPPQREQLVEKLRALNIDTLLLAKLVDRKVEQTHVPQTVQLQPAQATPMYGYYDSAASAASYSGGYTVSEEFALVETRLFDVATEQPFARVESKTSLEFDDLALADGYVEEVVKQFRDSKLIP